MPSSPHRRSCPQLPRPSPCTPTSLSSWLRGIMRPAKLELLPRVTCWLLLLVRHLSFSFGLVFPLSHASRFSFRNNLLGSKLCFRSSGEIGGPCSPRLPLWGGRGRSPLQSQLPWGGLLLTDSLIHGLRTVRPSKVESVAAFPRPICLCCACVVSSERGLPVDLVKSSRIAAPCFNYYKVSSTSHPQDTLLFFFLIDTSSVDKTQTNINYQLLYYSYYCYCSYCSYPHYYITAT